MAIPIEMANDVLDHHHGSVHDHAKVQGAQRKKVGRNVPKIQQNGSKQQRKRNSKRDNQSATRAPEEKEKNNDHQHNPLGQVQAISFETLVEHYRLKEMAEGSGKTFATRETYEGPQKMDSSALKSYRLRDVKSVVVEEWLKMLPLANGSRAKIRNIMHVIFNHAIRWEWHSHNPVTRVRQSAKRMRILTVLSVDQIQALLNNLREPVRILFTPAEVGLLHDSRFLACLWRRLSVRHCYFDLPQQVHNLFCTMLLSSRHLPLLLFQFVSPPLVQIEPGTPSHRPLVPYAVFGRTVVELRPENGLLLVWRQHIRNAPLRSRPSAFVPAY